MADRSRECVALTMREKIDILSSEVWERGVVAMFIQIVGVQTLDLRMTNKIHHSSHSE